jgi:hypothetical protein
MEFLNSILSYLSGAEGMVATLAIVVEFVLRLVPSEKPRSIAYAVGGFVKVIGAVFTKLGELLDKILPQKLS